MNQLQKELMVAEIISNTKSNFKKKIEICPSGYLDLTKPKQIKNGTRNKRN